MDPPNILSTLRFVEALDREILAADSQGEKSLVCSAPPGKREYTDSALLLGGYMILKLRFSAHAVANCFKTCDSDIFEPYRDAGTAATDAVITLVDCWRALERGKNIGWIRAPSFQKPYMWGMIDRDEYDHYDNPLNADLNEIVPGKLIAFRGPRDLGGQQFSDRIKGGQFLTRDFSPEYYADMFVQLGVSTVVRLSSSHYDRRAFVDRGFQHFDLSFEGQATPTPQAVADFFRIVEDAPGVVAIHGRESLGRCGVLIALYAMRRHGFKAREAVGWVRMLRSGSVHGEQLEYLAGVEDGMKAWLARESARATARAASLSPGRRLSLPLSYSPNRSDSASSHSARPQSPMSRGTWQARSASARNMFFSSSFGS
jgi:cell division cycle 14